MIGKLAALSSPSQNAAYKRLETLCTRFGHRISGSKTLESAIDWVLKTAEQDGLENVRGEKVTVYVRFASQMAFK